jgi:amino acid transporter
MSLATFFPRLESIDSLTYLSIILFNFMGFEVIATFTSMMENPQRDIPKALVVGGAAIVAVYIFCSFGISAAISHKPPSFRCSPSTSHPLVMKKACRVVTVVLQLFVWASPFCQYRQGFLRAPLRVHELTLTKGAANAKAHRHT